MPQERLHKYRQTHTLLPVVGRSQIPVPLASMLVHVVAEFHQRERREKAFEIRLVSVARSSRPAREGSNQFGRVRRLDGKRGLPGGR